jgi:predicted transcriptional regulator
MVRTIDIPDELATALKELATIEHRSVNATLIVAAEQYVQRNSQRTQVAQAAQRVMDLNGELLDRLAQ